MTNYYGIIDKYCFKRGFMFGRRQGFFSWRGGSVGNLYIGVIYVVMD
ncbi:hypothetical protein N8448_03420 [Gammaproteobacteria bacterium]|nr:hypothetical protein [Gammaproteobacteria bacterium]